MGGTLIVSVLNGDGVWVDDGSLPILVFEEGGEDGESGAYIEHILGELMWLIVFLEELLDASDALFVV